MAAFSRLQLAAALLEYDNDNPNLPHRSAHESAIFAPMRRDARPSSSAIPRRSDYLGVSLPSETGSIGGRESVMDGRKSRGSIGIRNFFSEDRLEGEGEEEEEEVPDVDLTSWGLDAFMSKEKATKAARGKAKSLPSTQPLSTVPSYLPHTDVTGGVGVIRRPKTGRSMSVGNYDFLTPVDNSKRRQSIGSPLDLAGLEVPAPFQKLSPTAYDEPIPVGSIPFPTASVRSPSPGPDDFTRHRTYSRASMDSQALLNDNDRHRAISSGTMDTTRMLDDDNPFALRPPSQSSKFDPKAAVHARTMSNASFGSRMMLDNDAASVMTQNRKTQYSTKLDLLRPKVLVMPSPLQSSTPPPPPPPQGRDGFQMSAERPLPPGARSTRGPIASNSFIPNPRNDLTLSQMTFRNNLMVDGKRDITFDDGLPRALEDGQQAQLEFEDGPVSDIAPAIVVDDSLAPHRPAGKLFGKSLIDDLENRKAQMKGRQRVFTGDDRPSMMKRGTLIDPDSLRRPASQHMSSYDSTGLSRRNSANVKPLLNFDEGDNLQPSTSNQKLAPRSVFGVDTLWEREMVKLKEIEAQEALERERREKEEAANPKKKKKGRKGKQTLVDSQPLSSRSDTPVHSDIPDTLETRAPVLPAVASSAGPPILPAIAPVNRGPPPVLADDGSDSEESNRDISRRPSKVDEGWNSSSSEDEPEGPKRTTGVGLRYPANKSKAPQLPAAYDSEDEDVPLSMAKHSTQRPTLKPLRDDDSDEEKPLSMLLDHARLKLPEVNFDRSQKADDDDDAPLGLRASRVMPSGQEDDDLPLAFHPQQQMRTQQQMVQQQQQMMMMQNSMAMNSMFFNPSMSGFFPSAPMMMQPMVQAPIPMPSPPPVQDTAKLNRVDRWRHDVAIES